MRKNLPSIKALIIFEAAAKNGSFSRAADQLCLTQTAVSKQIINLEQQLATKLFIRKQHHVTLTASGQNYYINVHKILDDIAQAGEGLRNYEQNDKSLIINITPSLSSYLIEKINDFNKQYPDISVAINSKDPCDFSDEVDVIIKAYKHKPKNCQSYLIKKGQMLLVAAGDVGSDLNNLTFLQHSSRPKLFADFIKTQNLGKLNFTQKIKFEHFFMIITALKNGYGVGLVPDFLVKNDIEKGNLINLHNISYDSSYSYYLTYLKHKFYQTKIMKFNNWAEKNLTFNE